MTLYSDKSWKAEAITQSILNNLKKKKKGVVVVKMEVPESLALLSLLKQKKNCPDYHMYPLKSS